MLLILHKFTKHHFDIFQIYLEGIIFFSCRFVVYLSTPCDDAISGKKHINGAMNALFHITNVDGPVTCHLSTETEGSEGENKPALKWSLVYGQELKQVWFIFVMQPNFWGLIP